MSRAGIIVAAERRDDLAGERTRILNRVHGLLRDLLHGGRPSNLTTDKAAALLRGLRPRTATAACRRQLVRDLLGDLRCVVSRAVVIATGVTADDGRVVARRWAPSSSHEGSLPSSTARCGCPSG